jgi:hypothetical protein
VFAPAGAVASTLALLVPGFVALKIFYRFALRTERTDAQWAIWSILATVPIGAGATLLHRADDGLRFAIAVGIGVAAGVAGALLWRLLLKRFELFRASTTLTAWDRLLDTPRRVHVWTKPGYRITGWTQYVALNTPNRELDVYLDDASVTDASGRPVQIPGLRGVLIARSEIHAIAVLDRGGVVPARA